jgi:flagellar hook-associated protein 2
MTTTIGSTGSISSPGIGSGLDVNSIIAGLMKVEQAPLTQLKSQATSIQTTISAFGTVQSTMSSFRDAAAALALPSTWNATTGSSSDSSAVSVATSAGAAAGNYAIQVLGLAAAQSTVSGTFASSDALVGAGTLHVDLGTWSSGQSSFAAKAGATGVDITVTATDTLATLADKVNSAGAGLTASVVNDASGARLVLSSSTTGTGNAFRVTASDADGSNTDAGGLSALAFDPAGGTTTTTLTQAAADASATINGLSVTSATNSLGNVLSGLTVNLSKVTTSPVQVSVAQDTAAIKKSVQGFVDAYNALSSLLSTDLKYDSSTKAAGPLQADSAAVSLQRQLRNMIGSSSTASSVFSTLSQVGLQVQTDGTLQINDTALTSALANPTELKKLFTNVDTANPGNDGVATQSRSFGDSVLGSDGLLTTRVGGLNTKLADNQKDQDAMTARLAATQARLQAQYTALDTQMASLNTLSSYITQQIANWNNPNSSGK